MNAVRTFERSLDEHGVTSVRTSVDALEDELEERIEPPVVGTRLPFEGVDLPPSVVVDPTPNQLEQAATGITSASLGVGEYGSIVLESCPEGAEQMSLFPGHHIAILRAENIVPDMAAAFEKLGPRIRCTRGSAVLATGPSATADMGALVRGAHGPAHVTVLVVESIGLRG